MIFEYYFSFLGGGLKKSIINKIIHMLTNTAKFIDNFIYFSMNDTQSKEFIENFHSKFNDILIIYSKLPRV